MAVLGLCLIVPVAAHAASVFFKGKVTDEPKAIVGFEFKGPRESDGGIAFGKAKVEDFVISGVKVTQACVGKEAQTYSSTFVFEEDIGVQADGDFKGIGKSNIDGQDPKGNMVVKGQYSERNAEFVGSFKMREDQLDPAHGDCVYEVAKVHWTAHRI